MNKSGNLIIAAALILISAQPNCLATDFDPLAPPASSVSGAGGNNAGQVVLGIQNSKVLSETSKHVNVIYENGAVVITGTVASDRDRQEISGIAEKCGCANVRNEVKVAGSVPTKKVHQAETITIKH